MVFDVKNCFIWIFIYCYYYYYLSICLSVYLSIYLSILIYSNLIYISIYLAKVKSFTCQFPRGLFQGPPSPKIADLPRSNAAAAPLGNWPCVTGSHHLQMELADAAFLRALVVFFSPSKGGGKAQMLPVGIGGFVALGFLVDSIGSLAASDIFCSPIA